MNRSGIGIDVHKFIPGDKLIIAGVEIPYHKQLAGHSDADVLSHAICDAILGAMAKGDIGEHFPDTDEKYKDISGLVLLDKVMEMLNSENYQIANIDTTILLEEPKITPFKTALRNNIAKICQINFEQVSVKATTTEKLGFCGRGEGVVATAIVNIFKQDK